MRVKLSRRARWGVPGIAIAVTAGAIAVLQIPAAQASPDLPAKTVAMFKDVFGDDKVQERGPVMGGEDFSRYGKEGVPIFLFWLGTIEPDRVAEAAKDETKMLPSLHSDQYYPIPKPSIQTGVRAMSLAVMNLMNKQ